MILYLNNNPKRDLFAIVASEYFNKVKFISFIRSTRDINLDKRIIDYINNNINKFVSNSLYTKKFGLEKELIMKNNCYI